MNKINHNQKELILMFIAIFQIFLMINMIPCGSYMIHQTDSLIEEARIEIENKDKGIIDSGVIDSGINLLIGLLSIKQIGTVSAAETSLSSWCCPKTKTGIVCQNIPIGDSSSCSETPIYSSCEKTTRCKTGTCIDEAEGICSVGTGYECEEEWIPDFINSVEKCKFGCCLLDEETSKEYVRQVRCTKEGGIFDTSISQSECRVSTDEMGACILEELNCKLTTGDDCELNLKGVFYKGSLCSNPDLGTKCEKPKTEQEIKTICYENKVYFLDSCGNLANIYNSDKFYYEDYWKYVQEPECDIQIMPDGSIDETAAESCGNCDSLSNRCGSSSEGEANPNFGDYVCKSLNCEKDPIFFEKFGRKPVNQESWCVYESYIGEGRDVVGSEYRVAYCDKGIIKTELCENYRGRICGEKVIPTSDGREISVARCRFNEGWKCYSIELEQYEFNDDGWLIEGDKTKSENQKKCESNSDCIMKSVDLHFPPGGDSVHIHKLDFCVPKYPPGLKFWEKESNSKSLCSILDSAKCTTVWSKWGNYWCTGNCGCLSRTYTDQMNDLCTSLGDCGGKANVVGVYTGNFKAFNIDKDMPEGKDFELESYIESDPYINFGSEKLDVFARGDISDGKKEEYKKYADNDQIGKGEPPKFFSSTEEGLFGGDPFTNLGFGQEGWEMKKTISVVVTVIVVTIAVTAIAIISALVAVEVILAGIPIVGWIIDIIILIVAAIVILIIYLLGGFEDPIYVEIEFICKPWQAPMGGKDCKTCNEDPARPCTEYKCKSLGSTCNVVGNAYESENPICVSTGDDDVLPPVISFDSIRGDYTGEKGDNIVNIRTSDGECLNEFSLVNFTLKTEEGPNDEDYAICVYSFTGGIDPPSAANEYNIDGEDFLEGRFYSSTHTFDGRLPLLSSKEVSNVFGNLGDRRGDLNMYVRCMDAVGNANLNEYVVNFCIKEGADKTAAEIMEYTPKDRSYFAYGKNETNLRILLNEPVDCVWSQGTDKEYDAMNEFDYCEDYAGELKSRWECVARLTGLNSPENKIYIKCKDQPWISEPGYTGTRTEADRNVNGESYIYTLFATQNLLKIDSITPQGELIKGATVSATDMNVVTSGGAYNGVAKCEYEFVEPDLGKDIFFQTNSKNHKQTFSLMSGTYNIKITCEDNGGNKAEQSISLNVILDSAAPKIVRAYKDGDNLKVLTDEKAKCYYDTEKCSFDMSNSTSMTYLLFDTEHTTPWKPGVTYYIKCKDVFDNINSDCTQKITPSS